jgi:molybdenum cofactor cytidylyltransferase
MVSAVVLAAGASTRMGTHKLLLPLGGEPLVRRVVRQVAAAGFDDLLVVVGREHESVLAALDGLSFRAVWNQHYADGLGSSFRTAIAALGASSAAMFTLADQPFVSTDSYRRILAAHLRQAAPLVCARYDGMIAPPQLFARDYFGELAALAGGARDIVARDLDKAAVVDLPAACLLDVDTPADYERARTWLAAGS